MNKRDARENLKSILARRGLCPTLVFLNSLTAHRFTAIYHFHSGSLEPVCVFDRLNPKADSTSAGFVRAACITLSGGVVLAPLPIAEAAQKRRDIQSYCGVSLRNDDGATFGFICHFDFRPVPISPTSVELLEEAAMLLSQRDRGCRRKRP